MANLLSIVEIPTVYPAYNGYPYAMLAIDGIALDRWLLKHFPDQQIEGLVPAQKQLNDEHDLCLAWRRIMPGEPGLSTIVPLLICPDDMDFTCSVIVTEQYVNETSVIWQRFGFAVDHFRDQPGGSVRWLTGPCQAQFEKTHFVQTMKDFQGHRTYELPRHASERGAALIQLHFLVEAPVDLLETQDGPSTQVDLLEHHLTALPDSLGYLKLFPEIACEWVSQRRLTLDPQTMNCGKCQKCGQWTTDCEAPEQIEGLCHGARFEGKLLCDDCLPHEHPWAF